MTEQEILEYIVEHEDCNGITCSGNIEGKTNYGTECPLHGFCDIVLKTNLYRTSHCIIDEALYELYRLKEQV